MKYMVATLMSVLLLGCYGNGTEGGNPNRTASSNMGTSSAAMLMSEICSRLETCYSGWSDRDACERGVQASTGVDTQLGLAAGYGSYQTIIAAEFAELLTAHRDAADRCAGEIRLLSCADPRVQSAYNPEAPNDFSHIGDLFSQDPGSCPDVF